MKYSSSLSESILVETWARELYDLASHAEGNLMSLSKRVQRLRTSLGRNDVGVDERTTPDARDAAKALLAKAVLGTDIVSKTAEKAAEILGVHWG